MTRSRSNDIKTKYINSIIIELSNWFKNELIKDRQNKELIEANEPVTYAGDFDINWSTGQYQQWLANKLFNTNYETYWESDCDVTITTEFDNYGRYIININYPFIKRSWTLIK